VLTGRLLQGFSAGVELGGVSVYLSEIATPGKKGLYVCGQSGSQQVAIMAAALIGFGLNKTLTPHQISEWGWRIPFFIGCLIIPLIFVVRRSLKETEAFKSRTHRPGAAEALRSIITNWPVVAAGMMMVVMTSVFFYLITVYTPTYGKSILNLQEIGALVVTFCVGLSNLFWLRVMGSLSDRVGRQPILLTFTGLSIVTAYPALRWLVIDPAFAGCLLSSCGSRSSLAAIKVRWW
jgi:MHS family citrate/tricarballylate:H+ symporter-like MFS transporter